MLILALVFLSIEDQHYQDENTRKSSTYLSTRTNEPKDMHFTLPAQNPRINRLILTHTQASRAVPDS